jgi:hypothetical protein
VRDLHGVVREKQSSILLPLIFPSLQHDGVGGTRLSPLQKERFPLAVSLFSPTYDLDAHAVKRHFPLVSSPT